MDFGNELKYFMSSHKRYFLTLMKINSYVLNNLKFNFSISKNNFQTAIEVNCK